MLAKELAEKEEIMASYIRAMMLKNMGIGENLEEMMKKAMGEETFKQLAEEAEDEGYSKQGVPLNRGLHLMKWSNGMFPSEEERLQDELRSCFQDFYNDYWDDQSRIKQIQEKVNTMPIEDGINFLKDLLKNK